MLVADEGLYGYAVAGLQYPVVCLSSDHRDLAVDPVPQEYRQVLHVDRLRRHVVAVVHGDDVREEVLILLDLVDDCFRLLLGLVGEDDQLEEGLERAKHVQEEGPELHVVLLVRDDVVVRCHGRLDLDYLLRIIPDGAHHIASKLRINVVAAATILLLILYLSSCLLLREKVN